MPPRTAALRVPSLNDAFMILQLLAVGIFSCGLALFAFQNVAKRRLVKRTFGNAKGIAPLVQQRAESINSASHDFIIVPKRSREVSVDGQTVHLIDAECGRTIYGGTGAFWKREHSCYTIDRLEQREWYLARPHIFHEVYADSSLAVYWVNPHRVLDTKGTGQNTSP